MLEYCCEMTVAVKTRHEACCPETNCSDLQVALSGAFAIHENILLFLSDASKTCISNIYNIFGQPFRILSPCDLTPFSFP